MEFVLAIWLHNQTVPQFVVGPNELGNRVHAVSMKHKECTDAASEALKLHPEAVAKAECIRRK